MNAVGLTLAKRPDTHFLQGYAFRLMAAMVMLSWAGWQALLIGGADHVQGAAGHATLFFEAGLVLLFYSLLSLLRLKRNDALPARESAQLFFGGLLLGLPLLTWSVWWHIKQLLADHHLHHAGNVSGSGPLYACPVISAAYLVVILIWLQTSVSTYSDARPGSWPQRAMGWLHSCVIDPYFK